MSWLERLYQTYKIIAVSNLPSVSGIALPPVCHSIQNMHVDVSIDAHGAFVSAAVLPKPQGTIIPMTEDSAARSNNEKPHGLSDKLQYVAGDYKTSGDKKEPYFKSYLKQLESWYENQPHPSTFAILTYIRKRRLIADLNSVGIELEKVRKELGDIFIRWRVVIPGIPSTATWEDTTLFRSWIEYESPKRSLSGLCLVSGEKCPLASKHPRFVRSPGDGARIISSNDDKNFTYRGRFQTAHQAAGISSDVTQKAHSALRWLIDRQGFRNGDQVIVAWALSGDNIPQPLISSRDMLEDENDKEANTDAEAVGKEAKSENTSKLTGSNDVGQAFAIRLRNKIAGYNAKLGATNSIFVMALDSAVPGRMAVTFFRELTASEFLERIESWHTQYAWHQPFDRKWGFIGVASPCDIAAAAFGPRLDDKLRRATVERLLPCIVDGRPLPYDLMISVVRRVNQRSGKNKPKEADEWEKSLAIACSLFRGIYKERNYLMSLEPDRTTRDYLFGRLLALAEKLEGRALYIAGEKRETSAARLMQRFSDRPFSTWLLIEKGLQPYKDRLRARRPGDLQWIMTLIDEVHHKFLHNDYINDRPLTGEYLLGYHCQRYELTKKPPENGDNDGGSTNGNEEDSE